MTNPLKFSSLCLTLQLTLLMSVSAQEQKPELIAQTGHSDGVTLIAFSPDGKILAAGGESKKACGSQRLIRNRETA